MSYYNIFSPTLSVISSCEAASALHSAGLCVCSTLFTTSVPVWSSHPLHCHSAASTFFLFATGLLCECVWMCNMSRFPPAQYCLHRNTFVSKNQMAYNHTHTRVCHDSGHKMASRCWHGKCFHSANYNLYEWIQIHSVWIIHYCHGNPVWHLARSVCLLTTAEYMW